MTERTDAGKLIDMFMRVCDSMKKCKGCPLATDGRCELAANLILKEMLNESDRNTVGGLIDILMRMCDAMECADCPLSRPDGGRCELFSMFVMNGEQQMSNTNNRDAMAFDNFKAIMRFGFEEGMIASDTPVSDLDMAIAFAFHRLADKKGHASTISLYEIMEEISTFTDNGIYERNNGWFF